MHKNNQLWLDDLKKAYPKSFKDCRVLEVGSKDWNGSVRPWFENCKYHGIDIEPGDLVDEVTSLKNFMSPGGYDTIIMFSLLEHDAEWRQSLYNLVNLAKPGTMLFMSWGAEGNIEHNPPWAAVPHQEVSDHLQKIGFKILDEFFEEDRYGKNAAGAYNLIAIYE